MAGSALPPKSIWRGNPVSATHKPDPVEIVRWAQNIEALIASGTLGDNWYETKALLNADLTPAANAVAVVYGDTTAANNGTYVKVGATGTGSWTQITNFLPGYQVVQIDDDGSSTANAYTMDATPFAPSEDGAALFFGFVPVTNTATSVTISFDGGSTTYAVKVLDGSNPAIGALVAGMPIIGTITASGANFRILTDTSSAANLILAQAAQIAAEAARDEAVAAAIAAAQKFFPVTVVDTAGGDPATDYAAGSTHDGVTVTTGNFILKATSGGDPADGVYVVPASGAASRSPQFAAYDDLPGAYFSVQEGTSYADTLWRVTSDEGGTLGVTDIVVERFSGGSGIIAASRTALKAVASPSAGDVSYLTEEGREGRFKWDASDLSTAVAADTEEGIYVSSGDGTSGAWVRVAGWHVSGINPRWFGAAGDGSTDDRAAFQCAINLAQNAALPTYKANVIVPVGNHVVSKSPDGNWCLLLNGYASLIGSGLVSVINPSGVADAVDTIVIRPPTNVDGFKFKGMFLGNPANGSRDGARGVFADFSTNDTAHGNWSIIDMYVGESTAGAKAMVFYTDAPGSIYGSVLERLQLRGGLSLIGHGDSVTVRDSIISGPNIGVETLSDVGASKLLLKNLNITSGGGAIKISRGSRFLIEECNIEQITDILGSNNASVINIAGDAATIGGGIIRRNLISGFNTPELDALLRIDNAVGVLYEGNTFLVDQTPEPVAVADSGAYTVCGAGNIYGTATMPRHSGAAYGPMGVDIVPTFENSWAASGSFSYHKSPSGLVSFSGDVGGGSLNTTIFTLPAAYRPTKDINIPVYTSSGLGGLLIEASTGSVELFGGGTTAVLLTGIQFMAGDKGQITSGLA